MRSSSKALWGLVAVLLVLCLWSDLASASTILDTTTDKFKAAAATFGSKIKFAGVGLLISLAVIQNALTALKQMLKGAGMEDLFSSLIWQGISVGFFLFVNQSAETILPTIIDGFSLLGQKGSGLSELTPSYVISAGIDVIDSMVAAYNGTNSSILDVVSNIFPALLIVISAIIILISFVILAAQMALAMISAYFWIAIVPFLVGFAGISFTKDIALNVLKGGVAIGMKLLTIYFVAGVAVQLGPIIGEEATKITLTDWSPLFWVLASVMILAYLSLQVPKLAGDLMNGTASLSAGDAGSNMMMLAAGAVGAASVGGGSALGGAVQNGMTGASSSVLDAARAGLATGAVSGAAAGMDAGMGAAAASAVAPPSTASTSSASSAIGPSVPPPSSAPVGGASSAGNQSGLGASVPPPAPSESSPSGSAAQSSEINGSPEIGTPVAPPSSSMGDATTATASGSAGGGGSSGSSSAVPPEKPRREQMTVQQRMRTAAEHMPADQQTVSLQAGVRGNIDV